MPPAPEHRPTIANVQIMRGGDVPTLAIGRFALADGLPERMDRTVGVRAELLRAPNDSFSDYLRQTLEAELTAQANSTRLREPPSRAFSPKVTLRRAAKM